MLNVSRLSVRYGTKAAVSDVSFQVAEGEWWMIVGPNGAGKSSLAGAISRAVPFTGETFLDKREIRGYKSREFAQKVGMLSQNNANTYAFTVDEVVSMGRYAWHGGYFGAGDLSGKAKIQEAIDLTGLQEMRNRSMLTLSGGETQRVFLAQVLAQDPKLLILDEPANHLDLPFQKQFFDMVQEWLKQPGRAVITVMHDLTLAKKYGTHALLMNEGKAAAQGAAAEVLTRENLQAVYGMDVFGWMKELYTAWDLGN
ncbi:MAG: ABC transporter ATP-binding protein [Clostridiales bacterium]|nr:ABC transporter ATP-binding protein [Clostridiales bacterium]